MTDQEEAYLSLLCLRDSTARIARLYWTYINLRSISGQAPSVLIIMLSVLTDKERGLHEKLLSAYPEDMAAGKWHDQEVQNSKLGEMTIETQEDLQKICLTEMKMMQLVSVMISQ